MRSVRGGNHIVVRTCVLIKIRQRYLDFSSLIRNFWTMSCFLFYPIVSSYSFLLSPLLSPFFLLILSLLSLTLLFLFPFPFLHLHISSLIILIFSLTLLLISLLILHHLFSAHHNLPFPPFTSISRMITSENLWEAGTITLYPVYPVGICLVQDPLPAPLPPRLTSALLLMCLKATHCLVGKDWQGKMTMLWWENISSIIWLISLLICLLCKIFFVMSFLFIVTLLLRATSHHYISHTRHSVPLLIFPSFSPALSYHIANTPLHTNHPYPPTDYHN